MIPKVFTQIELESQTYLDKCIGLFRRGMLGPYNGTFVELLIRENERLKRGEFTEEEFQYLCHNFDEKDACRFKQGCIEYQKLLFGKE